MTLAKKKIQPDSVASNSNGCDVEACIELNDDEKYSSIAECAYYKAESRGFEPGHELDDWLAAEDEVSRQ